MNRRQPGTIDWTGTAWGTTGVGLDGVDAKATPEDSQDWYNEYPTWKSYDITTLTQNWVNGTAENHGVIFWATNEDDYTNADEKWCYSSEYSNESLRPKLIVTYSNGNYLADATFEYDALSRPTTVTYSDGVVETNQYDQDRGWITRREYKNYGTNMFYFDNSTYDNVGNLKHQVFNNIELQTTEYQDYLYNDLYQIKEFKQNSILKRSYDYDPNGNLKTFTGKTLSYGNQNNQLTGDGNRTFEYDAMGRVKKVNSTNISYDIRSNMTQHGGNKYTYDAFNQRVRKTENSQSTYYITSGSDILTEHSRDAYYDAEYIYAGARRIAKLKTRDEAAPRPPVRIKAVSKGWDDGNWVELSVSGVDYAIHGRGYNLVVIDETNGTVLDQKKYDTYASQADANAMANYINALPQGRIVLLGIMDEGSVSMTEDAYLALESLGSSKCRDVGVRDSHAFIGRVGAVAGTVQEQHTIRYSGFATAEVHKVDCRVLSAGVSDGDNAKLYVNGVDVTPWGRGHNLAVVDEITGNVLNTINYALGTISRTCGFAILAGLRKPKKERQREL